MTTTVISPTQAICGAQFKNETVSLGYARPFTDAATVAQNTAATGNGTSMVTTAFSATPTAGNILVSVISRVDNNAVSSNPAGWVLLDGGGNTGRRVEVWWYRSTGVVGDKGPFTFATSAGANNWGIQMLEFGGSHQQIALVTAATNNASSTTPAAQTMTQSVGPRTVVNAITVAGAATSITGAFSGTGTVESSTNYTGATYGATSVNDLYNNTSFTGVDTYGTAYTLGAARTSVSILFTIDTGEILSTTSNVGAGVVGTIRATAITQTVHSFDTSVITSGKTLTAATLNLTAGNTINLITVGATVPANAQLQARLYGTGSLPSDTRGNNNNHWWFGSTAAAAQTLLATYGPSAWVNTTAYNLASNAAMLTSINKTGYTHISLVTNDIVNSTSRATQEIYCFSTSSTLTVVYNSSTSQTVTASATATASSPSRIVAYLRTVATVSASATAAISRTLSLSRTIAAAAAASPLISRVVSLSQTIAASAAASPTVERAVNLSRTIAASVQAVPGIVAEYIPFTNQLPRIIRLAGRSTITLVTQSTLRLLGRSTLKLPKE